MKLKTVYTYNIHTGEYLGRDKAQESPREPGIFLMPKNSTEVRPPEEVTEGYFLKWTGNEWVEEALPEPEPEEPEAE